MSFKKESFSKVKYFAYGSAGSGGSAEDAAAPVDGDIMAIEAGMVIEQVDVVVSTAITGITQVDVGDDDDPDGFISAAALTAGVHVSDGAYIASGAKKAYSASGKEVKLDVAGTATAGVFAVVIKGYKI